jgi:hypothetical protein
LEEAVEARSKMAITTIMGVVFLVQAVTEQRAQSQAPLSLTLAEAGPLAINRLHPQEQAKQTRVEAARQEFQGVWRSEVLAKTA